MAEVQRCRWRPLQQTRPPSPQLCRNRRLATVPRQRLTAASVAACSHKVRSCPVCNLSRRGPMRTSHSQLASKFLTQPAAVCRERETRILRSSSQLRLRLAAGVAGPEVSSLPAPKPSTRWPRPIWAISSGHRPRTHYSSQFLLRGPRLRRRSNSDRCRTI